MKMMDEAYLMKAAFSNIILNLFQSEIDSKIIKKKIWLIL
jgi:hypothetical protein